jgi:hypothetical protein
VINCYGPYDDKDPLWDDFVSQGVSNHDKIIIGGDLHFIVNSFEVWGASARKEELVDCFMDKIAKARLVDVRFPPR